MRSVLKVCLLLALLSAAAATSRAPCAPCDGAMQKTEGCVCNEANLQGLQTHPLDDQQLLGQQQQQQQQQLHAALQLSDHPRAHGSRRSLQQLGPLGQYSPLLTPMDIIVEHGWDTLGKLAVLGAASGGVGMSALSHALATAKNGKAASHPQHSSARPGSSFSNGAPTPSSSGQPPSQLPASQAQGQASPGLAGQVAGAVPSVVRGVAGDQAEPVLGTLSQGAQLLAPVAGPAVAPVLGAFSGGAQQQQQQQQAQPQGLMLESGSLMDFQGGLAGLGGGDSAGDYLGPGSSDWLPAFQSALAGDDVEGYTEGNPLTAIYSAFTGGDNMAQQAGGSGLLQSLLQLQQGSSSSSSNPIIRAVQEALSSSSSNPSTAGGNPLLTALRSALGADSSSDDATVGIIPGAAAAIGSEAAGSNGDMQAQRASISNMRIGQGSAYSGTTQAATYNSAYGSSGAAQGNTYSTAVSGSPYGGAAQRSSSNNAAAQGSSNGGAPKGTMYAGGYSSSRAPAAQGTTYNGAAQGTTNMGGYGSTYQRAAQDSTLYSGGSHAQTYSGARQGTANSGGYGSTYSGAYGSSYGSSSGSNMPLAAAPAAVGPAPGELLLEQGAFLPQQLQQQQQGRNGQTPQNPYGKPRQMVYGNQQQLAQSLKKYHTVPQWQHRAVEKALQGVNSQVPKDLHTMKKLVKPLTQTAQQTTHSIMYDAARALVEGKRFDNSIKGQLVDSTANAITRAKPALQGVINKTAIVEPWTDAARSIMKQKAQYVHDFANDMAENDLDIGFDVDLVMGTAANATRNGGFGILPNISKSLAQAVAGGATNFFNGTRDVGAAFPLAIQPLLNLTTNTLTNGVRALTPALGNAVRNTERIANGLVNLPTDIGSDAGRIVSAGATAIPSAITTLAQGVAGWGTPVIPWAGRGVDILANAGVQTVGAVGKVMHETVVPFTEGALKAVGSLGQSLLTDGFNAGTGEGLAATMQRRSPYQDAKLEDAKLENQPALMLPQSFMPIGAMMTVRYPCPALKPLPVTGPVPGQPAVPVPRPQIPGQPPLPGAVPEGPPTAPVGTIVGPGIPCGVDLFMVPKHAVPRQGIPRKQPIPDVEWTLEPQKTPNVPAPTPVPIPSVPLTPPGFAPPIIRPDQPGGVPAVPGTPPQPGVPGTTPPGVPPRTLPQPGVFAPGATNPVTPPGVVPGGNPTGPAIRLPPGQPGAPVTPPGVPPGGLTQPNTRPPTTQSVFRQAGQQPLYGQSQQSQQSWQSQGNMVDVRPFPSSGAAVGNQQGINRSNWWGRRRLAARMQEPYS